MHTVSKERNGATHPSYINYCLKSEVSITSCCQLCFKHYGSRTIQKHLCNPHIPIERIGTACPSYHLKSEVSSLSAMVNPLHNITNQELFKKHLSNQSIATMKITDNFHYNGKPSCTTAKSTLFTVSKDEWDSALYILQYAKGTSWVEAMSNSEKIQAVALAII